MCLIVIISNKAVNASNLACPGLEAGNTTLHSIFTALSNYTKTQNNTILKTKEAKWDRRVSLFVLYNFN